MKLRVWYYLSICLFLVFCVSVMTLVGCAKDRTIAGDGSAEANQLIERGNEIRKREAKGALDKDSINEVIRIEERLYTINPDSEINIYNLAVYHSQLGNWDQAALWKERLYSFLLKEGVGKCGEGLTNTALVASKWYYNADNIEKAILFAQRAQEYAQKIGDDKPDCSGSNKYTHDDQKIRVDAKEWLDRLNSIPLKPNPIKVMASGPANKKYANSIGQEFIYIPPGSFVMGDDATAATRKHTVKLTKGYYLQKTEVTQEQWLKIMGSSPSYHKGKNNPVTGVTIADVNKFISKLNGKENTLFYRLPTEAEWEYASRAGTDTTYFFGNDSKQLNQFAWDSYNSGDRSHPVATRHPNQWGFYDMLGNVSEMVSDYYDKNYFATSPTENPQGPLTGDSIIIRGGARNSASPTVYQRHPIMTNGSFADVGFRLIYEPLTEDVSYGRACEINRIEGYDAYLKLFPQGIHITDVQKKIITLKDSLARLIEMVPVKGGCFQMGDIFGDGTEFEKPVHEVCVSDFVIGKFEVTQGQWEKISGKNPSSFEACGADCPVESVSWEDVQSFIRQLNKLTGKKYRLPTEAEWEYAARSGGKKEKFAGGDTVDNVAWYDQNSNKTTHKVGSKRPNGLGLYDMSGNVLEWVSDWYGNYTSERQQDPQGPTTGSLRIPRGGSWFNTAELVRTTTHSTLESNSRNSAVGFRLVSPVQ